MNKRLIVITIDTLLEIMKDYCKGEIPKNAKPLKLMYQPAQAGRLAILAESTDWTHADTSPIDIRFHLTRFHLVGKDKTSCSDS